MSEVPLLPTPPPTTPHLPHTLLMKGLRTPLSTTPRRASQSRGGPCPPRASPEAGMPVPKRASHSRRGPIDQSRGGPVCPKTGLSMSPKAGLSVPRRAHQHRSGPIDQSQSGPINECRSGPFNGPEAGLPISPEAGLISAEAGASDHGLLVVEVGGALLGRLLVGVERPAHHLHRGGRSVSTL